MEAAVFPGPLKVTEGGPREALGVAVPRFRWTLRGSGNT